jgi:hypothetical protein
VGKHGRRLFNYIAISFGAGLFLSITRQIEPLQRLDSLTREYQDALLRIAIATTAIGWLIFMASVIYMLISPNLSKRRRADRIQTSFTFGEIKRALHQGTFWRETRYRFLLIIAVGALTMGIGTLSLVFVLGEPGVKLIIAIAVGYACVRIVWGFAQA